MICLSSVVTDVLSLNLYSQSLHELGKSLFIPLPVNYRD